MDLAISGALLPILDWKSFFQVSLSVLGVFYSKSAHRYKEDLFWELSVAGLLQEQAMDSKPGWENPSDIVLLKVRERQILLMFC
jgi:hypothetical protein